MEDSPRIIHLHIVEINVIVHILQKAPVAEVREIKERHATVFPPIVHGEANTAWDIAQSIAFDEFVDGRQPFLDEFRLVSDTRDLRTLN